jgi:hypothetical protein
MIVLTIPTEDAWAAFLQSPSLEHFSGYRHRDRRPVWIGPAHE